MSSLSIFYILDLFFHGKFFQFIFSNSFHVSSSVLPCLSIPIADLRYFFESTGSILGPLLTSSICRSEMMCIIKKKFFMSNLNLTSSIYWLINAVFLSSSYRDFISSNNSLKSIWLLPLHMSFRVLFGFTSPYIAMTCLGFSIIFSHFLLIFLLLQSWKNLLYSTNVLDEEFKSYFGKCNHEVLFFCLEINFLALITICWQLPSSFLASDISWHVKTDEMPSLAWAATKLKDWLIKLAICGWPLYPWNDVYVIQQMFLVRNFNLTVTKALFALFISFPVRAPEFFSLAIYSLHCGTVILLRPKEIPRAKMTKMTIAKALIDDCFLSSLCFVSPLENTLVTSGFCYI